MSLRLIAVGQKLPSWVDEAVAEYTRRLPREFRLELIEVAAAKRTRGFSKHKIMEDESNRMLAQIPDYSFVVAMDSRGKHWDNLQLSAEMSNWIAQHSHVSFLLGGPDGLAQACLARADISWSLSQLTFPHTLVRVILAEQIYRTWSIIHGHPYHMGH